MENDQDIMPLRDCPSVQIDLAGVARLRQYWVDCCLTGHFWRLYYNDARGAGFLLNGKRFELMPDHIYLIPPRAELRTWVTGDPWQIFIHFEMNRLIRQPDKLCLALPVTDPILSLLTRLKEMLKGIVLSELPWDAMLCAFQLIAEALRFMTPETEWENGSDERITRVLNQMQNTLYNTYPLEELAQTSGMSRNAFLSRFREATGMTPHQYLLHIRYTAAARLLCGSDYSIETICDMIGIKDRFHFSRQFKMRYGVPPAAYRKIKPQS